MTQNDAHPVLRVQDCLNMMAGSKMFSTMDILSTCNQLLMAERDIPKIAFITKFGLFEFTTMLFGLMKAPATYQWLMELVLSCLQWSLCYDIIVFSRYFHEQVDHLDKVLTQIASAGMKLKDNKCVLFSTEVSFLGHTLSKEGILLDPENVAKILNWPVPKTMHVVRGILGLGSYYHCFVWNFIYRVWPLLVLTKKDKPFYWTEQCQKAFNDIKQDLVGLGVMAFPTNDRKLILDTDASDETIGVVLTQI